MPCVTPAVALGLDDAALRRSLPRIEVDLLGATTSRAHGDPERLRRILWWGSALADLPWRADEMVCVDGGRFNLAFALFDSVVDESPEKVPTLARALAPERLRTRMAAPNRRDTTLTAPLPELEPLVQLFDVAVASVGRRLRGEQHRLDHLGGLAETMFQSELRLLPDPFLAKTLPVVFIGALVDTRASTARFFRALAEFLWLWDDWLDLAEDLSRLRPNAFLGRAGTHAARASACARGAIRLAAGSAAHGRLIARLERAFETTLRCASLEGDETFSRTVAFQRELLG
jgi:hypothetical protein